MNVADSEYPAELVAAVDSLFTTVPPDLHDAIEDLFAAEVDWDEFVLDVMAKAPDLRPAIAALTKFAPHLGLDLT